MTCYFLTRLNNVQRHGEPPAASAARTWLAHVVHLRKQRRQRRARQGLAPTAPEAGANEPKPVLGGHGWDDLGAVDAPLTLIRGAHGYVSPSNLAEFEQRLPHASVVEVEAGHNVQETIPVALADLVRDRVAR